MTNLNIPMLIIAEKIKVKGWIKLLKRIADKPLNQAAETFVERE